MSPKICRVVTRHPKLTIHRSLTFQGLEPREMLRHHGWFHRALHAVEHLAKDVVKVAMPEVAIVKNLTNGQGLRESVENAVHDSVHAGERLLPVAIAVVGTAVGQPELAAVGADAVRRLESGQGLGDSLRKTAEDFVRGKILNGAVSAAVDAVLPEIVSSLPVGNVKTISISDSAKISNAIEIANKIQENSPIIDAVVTQYAEVGQIITNAKVNTPKPYEWPLPNHPEVSTEYGSKDSLHPKGHMGLDIRGPAGTPVVAARDGTVVEAGKSSGFRHWIVIRHDDNQFSIYGHVDSNDLPTKGTHVLQGDRIGSIGKPNLDGSEHTTGAHLHFEIRHNSYAVGNSVDPKALLNRP